MKIIKVAIKEAGPTLLDYVSSEELHPHPGDVVIVPLKESLVRGLVVEVNSYEKSILTLGFAPEKLKAVQSKLGSITNSESLQLVTFASHYYCYPLNSALGLIFPLAHFQSQSPPTNSTKTKCPESLPKVQAKPIDLNLDQSEVYNYLLDKLNSYQTYLLYGITGSGKTLLYLKLAQEVLQQGKQVLFLVPEIALAIGFLHQISSYLGQSVKVILHTSSQNTTTRSANYVATLNSTAQVVVGTRMAVFLPFKNLGLIVVDEEHDDSYKQDCISQAYYGFCYNARDLAVHRGHKLNIPVILGSATPSLQSLYNVKLNKYKYLQLLKRAKDQELPTVELVSAKKSLNGLAELSLVRLKETLLKKEISLIFINRRGFGTSLVCQNCDFIAKCSTCNRKLIYHLIDNKLHCHFCHSFIAMFEFCPNCQTNKVEILGYGSQKVESYLKQLLPEARILRLDKDSLLTTSQVEKNFQKIHDHEVDIVIGTQILSKGHNFPEITQVICLNVDSGLHYGDYRTQETTFSQMVQTLGRAGRGEKPGKVIIQTDFPNHPVFRYLQEHNYTKFATYLLKQRLNHKLPPITHYALLQVYCKKRNKLIAVLEAINEQLEAQNFPHTTSYPYVLDKFRNLTGHDQGKILLQGHSRNSLRKLLGFLKQIMLQFQGVKFNLDVDPYEL